LERELTGEIILDEDKEEEDEEKKELKNDKIDQTMGEESKADLTGKHDTEEITFTQTLK
jgi:hypothetical protein